MDNLAWITPNGNLYKLIAAAPDSVWHMEQINQVGEVDLDQLPVMADRTHRAGWKQINYPTYSKPYSPPKHECCNSGCGRESEYMFTPKYDLVEFIPVSAHRYTCKWHTLDGLTWPDHDKLSHELRTWNVEGVA